MVHREVRMETGPSVGDGQKLRFPSNCFPSG